LRRGGERQEKPGEQKERDRSRTHVTLTLR
jgi:hypothetical protein